MNTISTEDKYRIIELIQEHGDVETAQIRARGNDKVLLNLYNNK